MERMSEILVVDDSRVMRDMIVACLRADGALEFTQAASGLEAIEQLSLSISTSWCSISTCPTSAASKSRNSCARNLPAKSCPSSIVTTRGDEASRARALEAGASRYMTKPFTPDEILGEVRSLLAPNRQRLQ